MSRSPSPQRQTFISTLDDCYRSELPSGRYIKYHEPRPDTDAEEHIQQNDPSSSASTVTVRSEGRGWKYGQFVASIVATLSVFVTGEIFSWHAIGLPTKHRSTAEYILLAKMASVISPIPCSYIMDRIGRKTTLTYCLLLVVISWLMLAFSENVYLIMCAMFLKGVWLGVELTTVSIYIAEVTGADSRAWLISMMGLMFSLGVIYIRLISELFTNYLELLCLIPPVLLMLGFFFIPESPYFFLMQDRREEAEKSILWLRGECLSDQMDEIEIAVIEQLTESSFKEIFSTASNRRGFFIVECLTFCSATSFTMTFPLVYDTFLYLLSKFQMLQQQATIFTCLAWVMFALIPPALFYKFKCRSVMMVSTIGTVMVSGMAMLIWICRDVFLSSSDSHTVADHTLRLLIFVLQGIVVIFESLGITFIAKIVGGEIFPIKLKSKACALACMTACLFEFINHLMFYQINKHIGFWFHYYKNELTAAFCLLVVLFFMIETKGKSLEAIQAIMSGRNIRKSPTSSSELPKAPVTSPVEALHTHRAPLETVV